MKRGRKPFHWTPARDALLGTTTDRIVAARLGLNSSTVALRRNSLGIPPYRRHPERAARRWTAAELALLGTEIDRVVAARLGLSPAAVFDKRTALGIPPARSARGINWDAVPDLGRVRDADLARRLGVTRQYVHIAREARGIPPYRRPVVGRLFGLSECIAETPTGYRLRCRCGRAFDTPTLPTGAVRCGKCGYSPTDWTGHRFPHLTVLEYVDEGPAGSRWRFRCRCGKVKVLSLVNVRSGRQESCGCLGDRDREPPGKRTPKRLRKRART